MAQQELVSRISILCCACPDESRRTALKMQAIVKEPALDAVLPNVCVVNGNDCGVAAEALQFPLYDGLRIWIKRCKSFVQKKDIGAPVAQEDTANQLRFHALPTRELTVPILAAGPQVRRG